jgi:hypothetical protein
MFYKAAFTSADPESDKKTVKLSVFFALSGSACTKAACNVDEIYPKLTLYCLGCTANKYLLLFTAVKFLR